MNFKNYYFSLFLLVLLLSVSCASASEMNDNNITSTSDTFVVDVNDDVLAVDEGYNSSDVSLQSVSSQELIESENLDDVIVVNNWEELQHYCAQTDKNYNLKLKENTNFYPSSYYDVNQQIKIRNNVKIIGSEGSWFGDSSSNPMHLYFLAIVVEDNVKASVCFENVTFKWIKAGGSNNLPDGMFIRIGGKKNSVIKNCQFHDIYTLVGHSCILNLRHGTATLDNCSFINCTNSYGCISIYTPSGESPSMIVQNCYFEGNYASIEPGCINNCGKLTVYNSTFYKNSAYWWAAAIHTHCYASTTIYDSNFIDNVAGWNGGALYTYSYLKVYNSIFIGNNCSTDNGGGAIGACVYESKPHIYIEQCLFEKNNNNDGKGRGGAISLMDAGSLEVRDTTFIANYAPIGTAICARAVVNYGTPDVIIVNNSFINHTHSSDVLDIRLWNTSIKNVSDNYYYGNSIVFSELNLTKLNEGKEQATLKITPRLTNPSYYDEDILDKTLYDVYINNKYVKTVNTTIFTIDFGDLDICDVYVIPTISNRKSNEVTATSTREYIFVSKSRGDDNNNGFSRDAPVSSIKKALQLARNYQNIILLDGDYSEDNIQIDYDVCIKGEGNSTLTGTTSFISSSNFILKNLKIENLNINTFIKQNNNKLVISNCIFTNNNALLVQNNGFASLTNSILLNNSQIIDGDINNCVLDYNWWGNSLPNLNINNYVTLNLTSDVNALENNQKTNVKAVFYLNDGSKYTKLPDINLDISTVNGVASQNTTNIDSNIVYTLTTFSDGTLTVKYNDINVSKTFEFLKSNPNMSLTAEDIMVGDDLTITVITPSDASGNLTVNVGEFSQNKVIQSQKNIFTFEKLKADSYAITLSYTGDRKYLSKDLTSTVNVNKYESITQLNISAVNVGEDVILTVSTIDSSTGNVTLTINDESHTLTLNNSKANYTIKKIKRGDYLITAVYNGDDNYLSSQDSKFIEVDNLNASMTIQAEDITYGNLAIIQVTLNSDATGNVIVTVDDVSNSSKLTNGMAEVSLSNLEAGSNKEITVFYSGDDTYFNLTKSGTFNIAKADLEFKISSNDIMIGQFAEIIINVPQKTSGTFTIGEDVMHIPLSGEVSYIIPDLEIGNYTYTATYNGNNYNTVSKSTSFEVKEYPIPQVPNEGINAQNTHKSAHESFTNGDIAFTIPFNQTLSGDMVIDSLGNVYLPTQEGIYAFNQTSQLWYFTSNLASGDFSGIAIGRDVVIAPKSGDTLYFINQTTGERYGFSNIYQGSSLFAPVVSSNAILYIVSEYQYTSEDYKLTVIPYKLWENGGDPTLVSLGKAKPLCSPTLNDDIIVVVSENMLRMINAKTLEFISSKSGDYKSIRPVIGEGNFVYAVLGDSIVAYNANGVQVWKTKVTGKVGKGLAIDPEQAVYHINAKNLLYRYDIASGSESKVSNLKVTSGLLIGSDGTLYFGSNNLFYALDSEGNVLWKSDLGSKIIGNPVMDKNGLIYIGTENGITALTYAPLKDSDLKIQVDDIVEGQKATVTITWNSQATGIITCNVNGEEVSANADDLKIIKVTSALSTGYYDVEASYSGDMRFKVTTINKTFTVRTIDDVANNIQFDGNSTFSFGLNDARGNLTIKINDKTYSKALSNGNASIIVNDLDPGEYEAFVVYNGNFGSANRTFTLTVPKINIGLNESVVSENVLSTVSVCLPSDAGGNLTVSIGTKKYTQKVTNGIAKIIIDDLGEGKYTAIIAYSGDSKYEGASKTVELNHVKIPVELDLEVVSPSRTPSVSVQIDSRATGSLIVDVDGKDFSSDLVNGNALVNVMGLDPGNYSAVVTYSGDFRFAKAVKTVNLEVPRIKISLNETVVTENVVSSISVSLPGDASGDLIVTVATNKYGDEIRNGNAKIIIDDLGEGTYTAIITYSGDSKYETISKTVELTHTRIPVELDLDVVSPSESPVVSVKLDSSATGKLTVSVGDNDYSADLIKGSAVVNVVGLNPGNYSAMVTYSGDFRFANAVRTVSFEVPKITLQLNESNMFVSKSDEGILLEFNLPGDAGGDIRVSVNNNVYSGSLNNGFTSILINDLDAGNYAAMVIYSGDSKYDSALKSINLEVPKIILQFNDSNLVVSKINDGILVEVNLPSDADGDIVVSFNGKNYTNALTGGVSSVKITGLVASNWQATVTYPGNDRYGAVSKIMRFSIGMVEIEFNETTLSIISPSSKPIVSVKFNNDVTGNITVIVEGMEFKTELAGGCASLTIGGLNPGNHSAEVVYSGDDKYGTTEKLVNLEVPKINASLDNIVVKSNVSVPVVSVVLPDDAGGTLTVNINGKEYTRKVIDGSVSVEIAGLGPGNYTAQVIYSGDNNYSGAYKTVSLEVPKIIINLNDNNCMWNVSRIAVNLNNATGSLTVIVDDKTYSKMLTDGNATVDIGDLLPGNYKVKIIYSGDNVYAKAERVIELEIPKLDVDLDDNSLTVDSSTLSVNLPSDATGKLMVVVSGKSYSRDLVNGKATIEVNDLAPGDYDVTVIYSGDSKYGSITKSTNINVPKVETELNDDTLVVDLGSGSSIVSIDLPSDATGTLTVTVDGKDYTERLVGGKATVNVPELSDGTHNITVTYSGDAKYGQISKSSIVSVNNTTVNGTVDNSTDIGGNSTNSTDNNTSVDKVNPVLIVSAVDVNVGEEVVVSVKTSSETGKIVVNVNNKDYELVISNGESSLTISDLAVGNYTVIAKFAGDDKFNEATNSTSFRVLKVTLPVTDETIVIPEDNSGVYSISLPDDATGTLTVTVDGKEYTQTLINGKATVNIPELSEGSHNITVTYSSDGKYEPITKTGVVSVNGTGDNSTVIDNSTNATDKKIDPVLIVSAQDINGGETAIVNVKTSIESGKIVVSVNNKDYELVVGSGESSISISDLAVGNYIVVARFAGDDRFNEAENSTSFSVLKVNVPVTNETISIPEDGDSTSYRISLPSDATGTLTVTVDGKEYTETLVNGKATVNIPELATGTHNITVKYSGDGKYAPIIQSGVVTKEPVVKLTGSNLVMLYTSGKYFKVRLTGDGQPMEGKTVKITINGKTYTRTTNANGYASVKIKFAPKTYQATAVYGDLKLTKKVTVKSIISAKNINAKKSAKSLKVKVSLKKVNGKYLKNKKVTLKFNKKTYKLKTNKKGVVTFTIKKNVYSKLKLNKKYTYKVTYGKNTVKKTIKFKK